MPNLTETLTPDVDFTFVRRVVRSVTRHLPPHMELDDIIQEANIAAWRAAKRYDQARGVTLETYLYPRIVGAVRDFIRDNLSTVTRSGVLKPLTVSLNEPTRSGAQEEFGEKGDQLLAANDDLEGIDLRDSVAEALGRLDFSTRTVLVEHLLKDRTLKAVGADFGLTEGRISQLVTEARNRLRRMPSWQQLVVA